MKKSVKSLSLCLMVLVLLSSMLAGCTGGAASSSSGTASASSTAPASSAQEKKEPDRVYEISWAIWVPAATDENNGLEERLMERMENVKFDLIPLERGTWTEQINTRVAGGDIPDIIYRDGNANLVQYAVQNVITEVPYDMAKEFAPDIYEATKDYGKEVWLSCNYNGKNYGLPIMQPLVIAPFTASWRKDLLEKAGVTAVPTTLDEAAAAFEKIINTDVNGSGKKDTYGMSYRAKDAASVMFSEIFSAFGVLPNKWMIQKDDTLKFGMVDDRAKDAVALLNDWYKKGYIDPEFVTMDNTIYQQKVANGSFVYNTWTSYDQVIPPNGPMYVAATSVNPEAKLELGPALKGPNGDYGYSTWGSVTSAIAFGKHLADDQDKLAKCLELVNFVCADTDDAVYVRYGTENTDWKLDDTGIMISILPDDPALKAKFGFDAIGACAPVPSHQMKYYVRKDEAEWAKYSREGNLQPGTSYCSWVGLFTNPEITAVTADINPALQKGIIDMITGNRPIGDFDAIRDEWYSKGGKDLTDEYNRAYKAGSSQIDTILSNIN